MGKSSGRCSPGNALLLVVTAVSLVAGNSCKSCPNNGSKGDITVAQSDATAPSVSLSVAVQGGNSTVTVDSGGTAATLNLAVKTGTLNIVATAKDQESGIQSLVIMVGNARHMVCDVQGVCSGGAPGSVQPMWSSTVPKLNPGEAAVSTSVMAQSLDLTTIFHAAEVPPAGGSLTESFTISATAINHLGKTASTPDATLSSKVP